MVIKASAAVEIRRLIAALGDDDDVRREAAIARLAVLGARAVERLIAAYESTGDRHIRIGILRALESVGDRRMVPIAQQGLSAGGDLGVAAASALRALLDSPHGSAAGGALDVLVAAALDPAADRRVRLAAFEALQDMPAGVRARVAEALQADPDAGLKARAVDLPRDTAAAEAVWQDALEGRLPDSPAMLREAAHTRTQAAALSALQKLIDSVRGREGSVRPEAKRADWQAVRGALHQALALRGSRVAVYDLRETIEAAQGPVPISFLAALHVLGDASCLEPLAGAYSRAGKSHARWRHQLGETFRAISRREKVTRRHAVMKRIESRWPEAARDLGARARPKQKL
jgi:hypothetical protein